jgi:hypothetical protein
MNRSKMSPKLSSNDLITVQPWDCEGIEPPWGWFPDNPPPKKSEKSIKLNKFKKVKITPGATGIIIEPGYAGVDDYDEHFFVMVEGKAISVPVRFLHKVE